MNNFCKEEIEPSLKLGRMIIFLKIVSIIHFIIILIDLIIQTRYLFFIVIQQIILYIGISSKYYGHYLLFILFCFFNLYQIIKILVTWAQKGFYKDNKIHQFCFYVFIFAFEIFCIFIAFQVYKQSKQEFRIRVGYANGQNEGYINIDNIYNHNLRENYHDNGNDNEENVPFRGQGFYGGRN